MESEVLRQLLADYQPAPAKDGALIRAAVRLAAGLDIPEQLVINLRSDEVQAGSNLYYFICEATNVGGAAAPSGEAIRELNLNDVAGCSEYYAWLVKLARALVNSLSTEFERDEILDMAAELAPIFSQIGGHSTANVVYRFQLETSRPDWAKALFR